MVLLPPQQLPLISDRARSTHIHPAAPPLPPDELRRFKSEPSFLTRPGATEQQFTDRLLRLLTSSTVPAECEASSTVELNFGADPPPRQGSDPEPGTCAVCMEDVAASMFLCLNTDCPSRFCQTCIAGFATEAVSRALYAVPWLHCPGCRARVPTASWSRYAPEALEKYKSNAEAMFSFRCSECHEPSTLFEEYSSKAAEKPAVDSFKDSKKLKDAWAAFAYAESQPDSLLDLLSPEELEGANKLLPSIVDIERRTCLHLGILRRNPFILTPCCDSEFCFKCKVGSHHSGETCEERQQNELDIHVQFCPECEVPTVRTEGCDHIVCVCGADWTWQNHPQVGFALGPIRYLREMLDSGELDPNWTEDDGHGRSLLMFAVSEGRVENAKVLIEAGADIHARDRRCLSVLLFALGAGGAFQANCVDVLVQKGIEAQHCAESSWALQAMLSFEDPFLWMQHSTSLPGFQKLMELSATHIRNFSVDSKHVNGSLLQLALQKGRASLARELVENHMARVDRLAPFWFLQGKISDRLFFDKVLISSGLGINDIDETADSSANTLLRLALSKSKEMARHLIIKHKASATFGVVAKPFGFWSSDLPIPKDLFDALVLQGANVWEPIPSPQVTALEEQGGWLLSEVVACFERRSRNFGNRAALEEADYLLDRILALWNKEADFFAQTSSGAALVVKAIGLADPARTPPVAKAWPLAKRLIEAGAALEMMDNQGRTPLLIVASSAAKPIEQLQVLLKAGANALAVNTMGRTASQVAAKNSWDEGVEVLRLTESTQRAAAEEAAWKAAQSGDGTLHNIGLRVGGTVQCTECHQRFDSEQILQTHRRFMHD